MAGKAEIARENGKKGGRPKGSTNLPRFADFVTDEERKKFAEFVMDQYMGDMRLAVFFGQNAYAKPVEHVDHTTLGKELPTPIAPYVPRNDGVPKNSEAKKKA